MIKTTLSIRNRIKKIKMIDLIINYNKIIKARTIVVSKTIRAMINIKNNKAYII